MSKKIETLSLTLDQGYAEQSHIYQMIMHMTADPAAVASLLRQLEANTVRRLNAQRQLDQELEKRSQDWFGRIFG